jgi:alpha-L-rhamnosidase
MIERGATTIWEMWHGIDEHGVPNGSLNHVNLGAVLSFLHRYVAGIRTLDDGPGYRRFRIQPVLGGDLTWVRAAHDCPYGRVESSWRIEGNRFLLDVVVPPGTTAEVCLPDGRREDAAPGRSRYECAI